MKRFFLLSMCLLAIMLSSAFSASLTMIDMSSSIYDEVEDLYIMEGKASPMGAKPWSEVDVQHLLDRISPSTEIGMQLKKRIQEEISCESSKDIRFKLSASLNMQGLYHTNDQFKQTNDIVMSKDLDESIFNLGVGFSYKENVALFMNVSLGTEISDIEYITKNSDNSITEELVGDRLSSNLTSNIPIVSGKLDFMNFPNRAYATFGYDAFRVFAGRDRLEWGNGVMGNMLLGDTLPYHDMLSLTFTGSKWFHYQLLVDFFTPFQNLDKGKGDDRSTLKGIRFLLGHRFEFSLFSGKLLFAVTDSIMYESDDMYIDPRVLNPMAFLHNGYIAGNSNSFAAIEIEYAPIKSFSLYGELGIDDIAMPSEPKPPENRATANGIGIMGGLRFRSPYERGYVHGNLEVVYTTPFIYHRANGEGESGGYDFYFISSTRYKDNSKVSGIYRYLSFPFGSDAIAGLLSIGYKVPGSFDITGDMFVMAHGVINKFSVTSWYSSSTSNVVTYTPSTENPFYSAESGAVEYTFAFGGSFEYSPLSFLDFNGGAYVITKANFNNDKGNNQADVQLSFGMKLHY